MDRGYVQIYTGNGKGKTTAAFGLAVRAVCAGKKVYIGQFVKDMKYSETAVVDVFPHITIEQLGEGCFIYAPPEEKDKAAAKAGLEEVRLHLASGNFDVVILDEVFIAFYYGLITDQEIIEAIKEKHDSVEVILTGRYAPQSILEFADLVTEMVEVKHYYKQGVLSRKGIDC